MALTRLKKHRTMLHLNAGTKADPSWVRIGKSTQFDLEANAQTETNDFIEDEMATTEIMSYEPGISQELQTNKGDPAFDAIYDMFYNLPTGEDVKKEFLFTFDGTTGDDEDGNPQFNAWRAECTVTLNDLNTVDEKIYFDLTINKIERVTVSVIDGVPEVA